MKENEPVFADWRSRCSAFLLDYILTLLAPALTLVLAVYAKRRLTPPPFVTVVIVAGYLATAVLFFLNYVYFYTWRGQSFGKQLMGIRVVRTDGRPISYKTALLRNIVGYPLSFLFFGLGIIWILLDRRRQGWHDKIASTIVIKD